MPYVSEIKSTIVRLYTLFKIQGDCDIVEYIGTISSSSAQNALRFIGRPHVLNYVPSSYIVENLDELIENGNRTGGEDSAIFPFLPFVYDSWIITDETNEAILAIETNALFAAMLKGMADMFRR
jgi:hypothetical protein